MTKTHLKDSTVGAVCGRVKGRMTDNHRRVDCLNCRSQPEFLAAVAAYNAAVEAEFAAQTPRKVKTLFGNDIVCTDCGGELFRERPRSLMSFHYVCEGCGKSVFPMTETGMST